VQLNVSDLTLGPAAGGGTFEVRGGSATDLVGDVQNSHVISLIAEPGSSSTNANLRAANSFSNAGMILMTSNDPARTATLALSSGTLTNTGTIHVQSGAGGTRTLSADLNNQDQLIVDHNLNMNKSSGAHTNTGRIDIAAAAVLSVTGAGSLDNAPGGIIRGVGTLDSDLTTFTNNGQIAPGFSAGILTIEGDVPFGSSGSLEIEIGGVAAGTGHDQLQVVGDVTLDGNLDVSLLPGFMPMPLDMFTVLTVDLGHTITGPFANTPGNHLIFPGGEFDVLYNAQSVVLTNFVVPEPSCGFLLVCGMAIAAAAGRTMRGKLRAR